MAELIGLKHTVDVADVALQNPILVPMSLLTIDERCPHCRCDPPHSLPAITPNGKNFAAERETKATSMSATVLSEQALTLLRRIKAVFLLSEAANWYESLQVCAERAGTPISDGHHEHHTHMR